VVRTAQVVAIVADPHRFRTWKHREVYDPQRQTMPAKV
jgi:hypothetical protein